MLSTSKRLITRVNRSSRSRLCSSLSTTRTRTFTHSDEHTSSLVPLVRQRRHASPSWTGTLAALGCATALHLRAFATHSHSRSLPIGTMTTYPTPPVSPPQWSVYTPSHITRVLEQQIDKIKTSLDQIGQLPPGDCTFDNTVKRMQFDDGHTSTVLEPALFLQYVAIDKEVRDASVDADKRFQVSACILSFLPIRAASRRTTDLGRSAPPQKKDFALEAMTRIDVYQALLHTQANLNKRNIHLEPEEQRLLDKMILDRKRAGLGLPEDNRTELLKLRQKIMALEVDFQKACNEENGALYFTKEELDGVPEEVINGYPKREDGKYKVTFKTPDIIPVFKYAHSSATRKTATLGYEGKTLSNAPLLVEIVQLRQQAAQLLGYPNHAGYILEEKMAKSPEKVFEFLDDLKKRLMPIAEKEKGRLLELKKEVAEKRGEEYENELYLWDSRYFDRLFVERNLKIDEEKIKEYFPVAKVVPAVLGQSLFRRSSYFSIFRVDADILTTMWTDFYRRLLNVQFFRVPNAEVWHEEAEILDVIRYAVWDAGNGQDGHLGNFLGYMHLDLFPRENKYGHAAVWGLIPGWTGPQGERNYPVVCMVANLAKPTPTRPALMKHSDVVTFMHELGHAFHGLCSETQFPRFHGTAVSRDFVEAPSQMLENWTWTKQQLRELSCHFEREGERLGDEVIEALVKSKNVNQGLFNLRQLHFGLYDMKVHTTDVDSDLTKLWCDLREQVTLVSSKGEYVGGQSGFAHITGGYSAGYYGYLYSQVFSADMFATVFEQDPMNAKSGLAYRNKILRPGGSRDEMESLKDFLGREPDNKAFLKQLAEGI
ncbi:BQ2448_7866 [Microbotryum intermedium]|uniref:BQ2448_7866 protein n=1 Tax=Microbotryum intermedium TaxID=269621 RepID=A0A238FNH5_9BASI|nr:BQ2448_7866 [Microbotryum intermedium]